MKYKIKSSLLPAEKSYITGKPIEQPVQEMLVMYDRGEDLTDSSFIRMGEWKRHIYCYNKGNTIESAYERQQAIIDLYESIKENGYNGSAICVWFDEEGRVHLYDGFHRIAIMNYLGMDELVNVSTDWKGIDSAVGKDFPLEEVLLKEAPQGKWTYQPVDDPRLKNWKVDRFDAEKRLDYILSKIKGRRVLDIGCSEGYYARELAKRGYDVTAVDRSAGLIAAARYLTTLAGLHVDYQVASDWSSSLDGRYDTILFLAIIHNDMKVIGVEDGIKKLELLRNKANVIFMEVPNNSNERGWGKDPYPKYDFHNPESIKAIEASMDMKAVDKLNGRRVIYMLENGKEPDPVSAWLTPYRKHYQPLFQTLEEVPCRNIMEVGVFDGVSAVAMIKQAAKLVPEEEIQFYGFDLFEEMTPEVRNEEFSFRGKLPPKMADVQKMLETKTKAQITLIKGNTRKTLKQNVKTLPEMDFIYIDGGHTIETTRNDWQYSSKLMHKDTVVYFDDYCDEMDFIGSAFIKDELAKHYQSQVMPEVDYYPRKFGRFKAQLLKVEKRGVREPRAYDMRKGPSGSLGPGPCPQGDTTKHFRFHLLGLPHAITRKEETLCAFTQLVYRLSKMLTGLGHEVYHYGTEGSELDCTEHIDVLTQAVQKEAYGDWNSKNQLWIHNGSDLAYRTFRKNAIEEIRKRAQQRDMILISNGSWLAEVGNAFPSLQAIEPIVGYIGYYSKYKVFASYAWMHHLMGRMSVSKAISAKTKTENFATGAWYDAVIPHFFDPDEFTFQEKKDDYYLFLGRLITRKGPHIAADLTKRLGAKLVVAGQPLHAEEPMRTQSLKDLGLVQPHIEYVGTVGLEERNKLLANARAVIIPSLYFEPFGLVVVEALLCGTPVITTDWGSFPEIVQQGDVGYRCRTMDDFLWAARNIDKIDSKRCREYAVANYSMDRVSKMYQEYFTKVQDLYGDGWYAEHPERKDLDWLRRY